MRIEYLHKKDFVLIHLNEYHKNFKPMTVCYTELLHFSCFPWTFEIGKLSIRGYTEIIGAEFQCMPLICGLFFGCGGK